MSKVPIFAIAFALTLSGVTYAATRNLLSFCYFPMFLGIGAMAPDFIRHQAIEATAGRFELGVYWLLLALAMTALGISFLQ